MISAINNLSGRTKIPAFKGAVFIKQDKFENLPYENQIEFAKTIRYPLKNKKITVRETPETLGILFKEDQKAVEQELSDYCIDKLDIPVEYRPGRISENRFNKILCGKNDNYIPNTVNLKNIKPQKCSRQVALKLGEKFDLNKFENSYQNDGLVKVNKDGIVILA